MKISILFISLLFVFQSQFIHAQIKGQEKIDSLEAELPKAKSDSNHVRILTSLSSLYRKVDVQKGIQYGNQALELSQKIKWKDGEIFANNMLGSLYYDLREFDQTEKHRLRSIELVKELNDTARIVNYLFNLSQFYSFRSDYSNALEIFFDAIEIWEIHDFKEEIDLYIRTLNGIGLIYGQLEDNIKALEYLDKAENLALETGKTSGLFRMYINKCSAYGVIGEYEKAISYLDKCMELFEGEPMHPSIKVNVLANYANVYELKREYDKSIDFYQQAFDISKKYGYLQFEANASGGLGYMYRLLAQDSIINNSDISKLSLSLNKQNNLRKSVDYFERSIAILEDVGELRTRVEIYKYQTMNYEELGLYKKALEDKDKYIKYKDSIFNMDKAKEVANLENKKEKAEKEKQIEVLKERELAAENEARIISYSASGGIGLVALFAFIIYRRLNKEKKLSHELDGKNKLVEKTHIELLEKNQEIIDSIKYAKTIQSAMLPWDSTLKKSITNYFVIFKPKDIVSGDFYWFKQIDNGYLIAVADCTGHGVPGSMLSMMGTGILDEAVQTQKLEDTGKILSYLNEKMIEGLNKQVSENESRDGMDICLIKVNSDNLQFSGAKRPLYLINENGLETIKGDSNSIAGEKHLNDKYEFSSTTLEIKSGTKVILTSDGFVDQIGSNGKKFGTKRLKEILSGSSALFDLNEKLESEFSSHKGSENQRDDVTFIALELD